jgi:hypothetical protein
VYFLASQLWPIRSRRTDISGAQWEGVRHQPVLAWPVGRRVDRGGASGEYLAIKSRTA